MTGSSKLKTRTETGTQE